MSEELLLYYNVFDEEGSSEVEEPIAIEASEELTKMIKTNYFCVNVIQKLFSNLRANEIMLGFHNEDQILSGIYDAIEKENYSAYRNKLIDLNVVLYANNDTELLKALNVVSEAENILSTSFLGLEYLLLKKVKDNYKKAILSQYANRMIDLAESVFNKKFFELTIDEHFIDKIVQHQIENAQELKKVQSKIESFNTRLKIIDIEVEKLNKEIKYINTENKKNEKKYEERLVELKELREQFVKERLTIFDKTKIMFFEWFGFANKIEAVHQQRELQLKNSNTFVTRLFEEETNILIKEENRKNNFSERKALLDRNIKEKTKVKVSLSKQLKDAKLELNTISKSLLSPKETDMNNNIDVIGVKSVSSLAKENVLFIHLFPKVAKLGTSALEEYVEMIDRSNIIRVFNPKLDCDVYPIVGDGFYRDSHQYAKGDFGLVISKGLVEKINSLTNIRDNEKPTDIFSFKDKIIDMKNNPEFNVLEAVIDKAEVYGYVAVLDNIIERDSEKKIKVSKIISAFDYLNKFNQHAIKNDLKELPMVFIINGEVLELQGLKFDKYKLSEKQREVSLDIQQAAIFVRKTFKITKNLQKAIEVTMKKDHISEKTREKCMEKMMQKFQTYFAVEEESNLVTESLIKDFNFKEKFEEMTKEEPSNSLIPSMWDDEDDNFKISISTK
jgi:hypothetical protein